MDFPTVTLEWIIFCRMFPPWKMVAKGSCTNSFWESNPIFRVGAHKLPVSSWCSNRECFLFILETKRNHSKKRWQASLERKSWDVSIRRGGSFFTVFVHNSCGTSHTRGMQSSPLDDFGYLGFFSGRFFPLSHRSPFISPQKRHSKLRIWCSWLVQ